MKESVKIKIDLSSPVIKKDRPVYMLHPGKGYHLFGRFIANRAVALDIPNINVKDNSDPAKAPDIDQQINRARAIRDWLSLNQSDRDSTKVDLDIDYYKGREKRRNHDTYIDYLKNLLWDMPKGSVIFVPAPDLSLKGFFCELGSKEESRVLFHGSRNAKYFTYLGRPILNIKYVEMRFVPQDVIDEKSRNSVITELSEILSERMYRLYYGSFIISGSVNQMEVDVPTHTFRPGDSNIINALANLVEDNLQKAEANKKNPHEEIEGTSLSDAAFLAFDESELRMHARLNSEGVLQIAAKSITPILVSIFLTFGTNVKAQEIIDAIDNDQIIIDNSKCPEEKELIAEVKAGLFSVIKMMGEDGVADVCRRVSQLQKRTGVTTDVSIQVEK